MKSLAKLSCIFPLVPLLTLSTQGCSSNQTLHTIEAPEPPDPDAIHESYCEVLNGYQLGKDQKKPPACTAHTTILTADYVRAGYRFVDIKCDAFFNTLADAGRGFTFTRKETLAGIAALSSSLALLHNTAQTLALIATGGTFAASTIDNAEDYFLLTKYQSELKTYVDQDRLQYKEANQPKEDMGQFQADDFVRGYANRCTVATIEQEISQAINSTKPTIPETRVTALSVVAGFISASLNISPTPTDAEMRQLADLLAAADIAKRLDAGKPDSQLKSFAGVYWFMADNGAHHAGELTPAGKAALDTLQDAIKLDAVGSNDAATMVALNKDLAKISGKTEAQTKAATYIIGTIRPQSNLGSATPVATTAKQP